MSDNLLQIYSVDESREALQRKAAVDVALALIQSAAEGGSTHFSLGTELNRLSEYASLIQDAVKPK